MWRNNLDLTIRLQPLSRETVEEGRLPVAFDLDDTLITSSMSPADGKPLLDGSGRPVPAPPGAVDVGGGVWVKARPGIRKFLERLQRNFLLGVCTAANHEWAETVRSTNP